MPPYRVNVNKFEESPYMNSSVYFIRNTAASQEFFIAYFALLGKIVRAKGNNMHLYSIIQIYDEGQKRNLIISDGKSVAQKISLFKNRKIDEFQVGKQVKILRDDYLDMEDVAYICDGGLYLATRPYLMEQYGCQCLIEYVAGSRKDPQSDRYLLERAIARACRQNGIRVSRKPNINLLKLISNVKGY